MEGMEGRTFRLICSIWSFRQAREEGGGRRPPGDVAISFNGNGSAREMVLANRMYLSLYIIYLSFILKCSAETRRITQQIHAVRTYNISNISFPIPS